jgi:drug/metabolite transporter (DMT)-like permease
MSQSDPASDSNSEINSLTLARQRLTGIALICGALLCFSCLDSIAKWLSPRIGIIETTFARYLFSVLLVSIFLNPWTQPGMLITKKPWMQAGRSLLLFACTVLNFLALQHLQLAQTMSIMFLTPLVVALLSGPILGEWVGPRRMAAIAVGFLGVLIVARPGMGGIHPAALYTVVGVICYAFYTILTRILAAHDSSATTMFYSGIGGLLLLLPAVPFVWKNPSSPLEMFLMIAIGAFGAVGHWLMIKAYRLAPAPILSPFIYSQIVWMMLLGYIFYDDIPDNWTLGGAAVVIASGLYLLQRERVTGRVITGTGKPENRL